MHKLPSQKVINFLAELYKTADYRDRMDIEKYAIHRTKVRANSPHSFCTEPEPMGKVRFSILFKIFWGITRCPPGPKPL
jgi:hypothetical protein